MPMCPRKGLGVEKIVSILASGNAPGRPVHFLSFNDLLEDRVQVPRNAPAGVVGAELAQIADVADMVAFARLFLIDPADFAAGHFFYPGDRFQDRNTVAAAAAKVIDLAGSRVLGKLLQRADDVVAVDVVPDLLAPVAIDGIDPAGERYFYEIGKKAVQFHPGMTGARKAPPREVAAFNAKEPAYFLRITFGGNFERPKTKLHVWAVREVPLMPV